MGIDHANEPDKAPVGLIAGWGRYPLVLAEVLRRQGRRVVCLAVKDHADPVLREECDAYAEFGLGSLGAAQTRIDRIDGLCPV